MKIHATIFAALLLAAATTCSAALPAQSATHAKAGIDWHKGNVDAAFALAKARNKPLFLYWGAVWCPPCNQVKATIFNRQGFIERSRSFVAVNLDGDSQDGQKLGTRFKVRGYPTMILFKPDGAEITRLPGEVDGERYLQVLTLGMGASRSMKDTLQAALGDGANVTDVDWRMLSYYSWDTDEQQLVARKDLVMTLQRLAAACPPGDTAKRLALSALATAATAKLDATPPADKAAAQEQVMQILEDARSARDNMDLLANHAAELVTFVSAPTFGARARLIANWNMAMQRLVTDATLSKTDRLTALSAQVALARLAVPVPEGGLDQALLDEVRQRVAQTERATTDVYERQSVINAAAHVLSDAGLLDDSDMLLKAELKRSHSPYYFMLSLASNAKKRGDKTGALQWYEQAYKAAKGPATRLQWGVAYLTGIIDLTPEDETRIERTAGSVLRELGDTQNAFYERNRSVLERMARKLAEWNTQGRHEATLQRVSKQLDRVCAKLPAADTQRATCHAVLVSARAQS